MDAQQRALRDVAQENEPGSVGGLKNSPSLQLTGKIDDVREAEFRLANRHVPGGADHSFVTATDASRCEAPKVQIMAVASPRN
jgi:hypothetical protein